MFENLRVGVFAFAILATLPLTEAHTGRMAGDGEHHMEIDNPQLILRLLQTALVREEIKLTDEQATNIKSLENSLSAAIREWGDSLAKPLQANGRNKRTIDEVIAPAQQRLKGILLSGQVARLQEILVQVYGASLFVAPTVVRQLDLTREQANEIKLILNEKGQAYRKLLTETGANVPQVVSKEFYSRRRTMCESELAIDKEAMDKVAKVLTPHQRERLDQMRGKVIDTKMLNEQLLTLPLP